MKLCIPADFDEETLMCLDSIETNDKIYEVYGNLNPSPLISSGRGKDNPFLPIVDFKLLKQYIDILHKKDIHFDYTINPSCIGNYELTYEGRKEILKFIEQLVDINIDSITVAIPTLIELIRANFPNLKICASTIIGIDNINKAKFYENLGCSRIVLKEDINRNFKVLEEIVKSISIPVELIVNTRCKFDCALRQFHYNSIAHDIKDKKYYEEYYVNKCDHSLEDILKIRWIRPEDIKRYENIGIDYFKVIGRTEVKYANFPRVIKAYLTRNFDGNLIELINNFNNQVHADCYIPNKKLNNFLDFYINNNPDCPNTCNSKCNYCQDYFLKIQSLTKNEMKYVKKQNYFFKHGIIEDLSLEEISRAGYEIYNK